MMIQSATADAGESGFVSGVMPGSVAIVSVGALLQAAGVCTVIQDEDDGVIRGEDERG